MSCFVAFHYRSYGTFFLHKNKLHNIHRGFTHYKYYRAMKLSYDDKVQIYELRKQGYSLEKLSNKFGINNSNIRYMIKLIDRYGIEFVKKGKNRYYSPDLKQEMIHKV
ncbi:transposase orfA, ISSmu1 [Streptococcus pneumoniae]|nr:transposase orfA, ISSmu1 [Streptococcus pneumoniae]VSV01387.1 transposase orfA, ISSmu1 [Streptococcus pneumoniae]